ncbi:PEP-CTERM-box response regulator transcription factor [Iodidimonas nitroreducens]|uniref:PEP-CTERM-box response regulator transcription factor n=1 Tax=Iodidimonas nitroreducens TaxID=1236968 RepID=A0A5A7NA58_9PROT|nr:PEP-CTERM-box response regulator transcription factor [Iodidimonas nitroreducens]GAK33389.1 acetoacetate metabolism regulatory protein AtoC [alpha proteobacterium Q-1]GER04624.1 PEP-CTERM-box response regulator transcription factor [Iodidimonas nitroreducens]
MNEPTRTLLIVDDDPGIRGQLKWAFDDLECTLCADRPSAIKAVRKEAPAVVLLDLGLPPDTDGPSEGLSALRDILAASPDTKVIIMTGQKERSYALKSVSLGAYDFYEKPLDVDELRLIVRRALKLYDLEQDNRRLQLESQANAIPDLITASPKMKSIGDQIMRLAKTDVSVLIIGDSGTGKELLSRGVHSLSRRSKGPFIAINCAAIPENLLESELFGYERGAFTGAHKTTIGKIEQAHEGTLMLDEIGDLPLSLQAKLLRVLQEKTIERVGGRKQIAINFRMVCATNCDLEKAIAEGHFREDLYYRVGEAVVQVPPLRDRPEDALLIAHHFLDTWSHEQGLKNPGFAGDGLAAISHYHWPGNVRELQSRIKRALATANGRISAADLDLAESPDEQILTIKMARQRAELDSIQKAMAQTDGNISEAARLLDVSRPTLYQLLNEHGLR